MRLREGEVGLNAKEMRAVAKVDVDLFNKRFQCSRMFFLFQTSKFIATGFLVFQNRYRRDLNRNLSGTCSKME